MSLISQPTSEDMKLYIIINRVARGLLTTFSRAVCRCMGAAMFSCGRLSCFTLSRLTAYPDVRLSLIKPEDPFSPLFNAILYSMSWVRKLGKSLTGSRATKRGENNYVHVYIYKSVFVLATAKHVHRPVSFYFCCVCFCDCKTKFNT